MHDIKVIEVVQLYINVHLISIYSYNKLNIIILIIIV